MIKPIHKLLAPLAAFALVFSSSLAGLAQGAGAADKDFVKNVIETDMAEIQLGHLALDKSSNAGVKSFAQRMIDDHTRLNTEFTSVANKIDVMPPTTLAPADQALKDKLEGLSGSAFDKTYVDAMVAGHRGAVADFKKEESGAQSAAVRHAAKSGEPTIAEHLRLAEALQGKM